METKQQAEVELTQYQAMRKDRYEEMSRIDVGSSPDASRNNIMDSPQSQRFRNNQDLIDKPNRTI